MKHNTMVIFAATGFGILASVGLSSCAAGAQQAPANEAPASIERAAAVEGAEDFTRVPMPRRDNGDKADYDLIIVETVHEGVRMTCSTKASYRAGVSCIPSVVPSP